MRAFLAAAAVVAGFALSTSAAAPPTPTPKPPPFDLVIVEGSPGGQIDAFLRVRDDIKLTKARVEVRGYCASACTVLVTTLPRDRVCVQPGAQLGFHAGYFQKKDVPGVRLYVTSNAKALLALYPQDFREWIEKNGGLGADMIWLFGPALEKLIPRCPSPAA